MISPYPIVVRTTTLKYRASIFVQPVLKQSAVRSYRFFRATSLVRHQKPRILAVPTLNCGVEYDTNCMKGAYKRCGGCNGLPVCFQVDPFNCLSIYQLFRTKKAKCCSVWRQNMLSIKKSNENIVVARVR